MTVPFVAAVSASCTAKATVAPRPATSAGFSAARVTIGEGPVAAKAVPAPLPATTLTTAAPTTIAAGHRRNPLENLELAALMLRAIERLVSVRGNSPDASRGARPAVIVTVGLPTAHTQDIAECLHVLARLLTGFTISAVGGTPGYHQPPRSGEQVTRCAAPGRSGCPLPSRPGAAHRR